MTSARRPRVVVGSGTARDAARARTAHLRLLHEPAPREEGVDGGVRRGEEGIAVAVDPVEGAAEAGEVRERLRELRELGARPHDVEDGVALGRVVVVAAVVVSGGRGRGRGRERGLRDGVVRLREAAAVEPARTTDDRGPSHHGHASVASVATVVVRLGDGRGGEEQRQGEREPGERAGAGGASGAGGHVERGLERASQRRRRGRGAEWSRARESGEPPRARGANAAVRAVEP